MSGQSITPCLSRSRPLSGDLGVGSAEPLGDASGAQDPAAPSRLPHSSPRHRSPLLRPAPGHLCSPHGWSLRGGLLWNRRHPPFYSGAFRETSLMPGQRTETLKHRSPRPVVLFHLPWQGWPGQTPWAPSPGVMPGWEGAKDPSSPAEGSPAPPSRPHDHTGHLARDCERRQAAPTPGIRNELLRGDAAPPAGFPLAPACGA